jgi:hypothetical protein
VSGPPGRRTWWAAPLLLAGFLLAAPKVFVLGPLALLLLLSRPRTVREWLWIAASVALAFVFLGLPVTLADRTVRAAGAFFTGAFVMTSLLDGRSLFNRALLAVTVATGATVAWFVALGIRWNDLRASIVATQWATYRALMPSLPELPPVGADIGSGSQAQLAADLARGIATAVDVWPAIHAIFALAGGWLAWTWYHRLATAPIGKAPPSFRQFTFSDHLVWLVIVSGAATLAPLPASVSLAAGNVLLFLLALYAGRGLAVIQTALVPAPIGLAIVLSIAAVLLLPLALIVATLIGLADTWLDLRRRMAPTEGALS